MLFRRKVLHGEKLGRKLGFPTVNFHIGQFDEHFEPGIYSCHIYINPKRSAASGQRLAKANTKKLPASRPPLPALKGALYFGPKGQGKNVLEIHILDYSGDLYGQFVSFEVGEKIRNPEKFESLEATKKQIAEDVKAIRKS